MVFSLVRITQVCRVKALIDITANLPWIIPAGYASVFMPAGGFRSQRRLRQLAGFSTDVNLHGWQIILLHGDGIAAAGLSDV